MITLTLRVFSSVDYQPPPDDYEPKQRHLGEPMWNIRNSFTRISHIGKLKSRRRGVPL